MFATAGRRGGWSKGLIYLLLLLVSLYCLLPLIWMVVTSLKTLPETFTIPPTWIPRQPTTGNYREVWLIQSFGRYFLNTLIVAGGATGLSMILASVAGYGFSRFRFTGSKLLLMLTLVTQMFPGILLVIPYFSLASKLGLLNSYWALILAYTTFALPFCIWMMKGFIDQLPHELDQAAMIDGCTKLGIFFRVILPLSVPGLVATAIFSFLVAWNEYLFAAVLTSDQTMYVLTVGIASNVGQFRIQWNQLMAGAVLATVPPIIFYTFLVRHLVEGLSGGAVKG